MSNFDHPETAGETAVAAELPLSPSEGGCCFVRRHWRPLALLVLSATLAVLYVIGRPHILFDDGDPLTYFRKAWWFIHYPGGMDAPSRGPGYPIWLIVTGAASLHTWWILAASQVAMGIAAPVLVYGILAPISRNAAFVGGLLFAGFGIPYVHMNWVMTEQLFLFMELVSLLLISRHLYGAWTPVPRLDREHWSASMRYGLARFLRSRYAIALALAYTTMVKPAAGPVFWLFLLVCLLFRVEPWKRYIGPGLLYAAIMMAWGTYDYFYSPVRFSPLGMPTSQALRNFAEVYYGRGFGAVNGWSPVTSGAQPGQTSVGPPASRDGNAAPAAPTIAANRGPASQRLYAAVESFLESKRQSGKWNVSGAAAFQLYTRYDGRELLNVVFLRPNPFYYQLLVEAAASAGGDALLREVAREHGNSSIMAYMNYLARNPTLPILGSPNPYVGYMFFMKFYRYREFITTNVTGARDIFLTAHPENLVSEENGPATRAFAQSVRFAIDTMSQTTFFPGKEILKDFETIEAFKTYVIENPYYSKHSGGMMGNIYQWMLLLYGEEATGRLLGAAALESMCKNSASVGIVVGDYLAAVSYAAGAYSLSASEMLSDLRAGFARVRMIENRMLAVAVEGGKQTQLPSSLGKHVGVTRERGEFSETMAAVLAVSYRVFKWAKPIMFIGMIVLAIPLMMTSVAARLVALLVPAYFLSAAAFTIVMIMPGSDPRHEEVYAFFSLLVVVLGIAAIPQFFRKAGARLVPLGREGVG